MTTSVMKQVQEALLAMAARSEETSKKKDESILDPDAAAPIQVIGSEQPEISSEITDRLDSIEATLDAIHQALTMLYGRAELTAPAEDTPAPEIEPEPEVEITSDEVEEEEEETEEEETEEESNDDEDEDESNDDEDEDESEEEEESNDDEDEDEDESEEEEEEDEEEDEEEGDDEEGDDEKAESMGESLSIMLAAFGDKVDPKYAELAKRVYNLRLTD